MQKLYFGIIAVIAVFSSVSCKQVCVVEGNLAGMSEAGFLLFQRANVLHFHENC